MMEPGDVLLFHGTGWYSRLIRLGQRLRYTQADGDYAEWNHAGMVVDDGCLVEAVSSGVRARPIRPGEVDGVHCIHRAVKADAHDRRQMVRFARSCLGQRYGWLTIIGLAIGLVTNGRVVLGLNGTEICSGLVAQALCRGAYNFPVNPIQIMPADLAKLLTPGHDPERLWHQDVP